MSFEFRPAINFTDRHGCFVALVGSTNSGKSFSALRLARGIAGPKGKVAALDTEGGRLLHLKEHFDFDVSVMGAPHRPERYLEAARAAQQQGYECLLIDSFSMEWRGVGGVLDWMDEELEVAIRRQKANAEQKGWNFDENRARNANKMAASIRPKMAHKLMVAGFLDLRIPIIFSIRGEKTLDPDTKKEKFKAQCAPTFPFEMTVSFRLAADRKGVIDLSDPESYKMEGAHRAIFRDGEQLSEKHGAALAAWARGGSAVNQENHNATQNAPASGQETSSVHSEGRPAEATPPARSGKTVKDWVAEIKTAISVCTSMAEVAAVAETYRPQYEIFRDKYPAAWDEIMEAIDAREAQFSPLVGEAE